MNQLNKKQLDTFRGASGNLAKADSSSLRPLVSKKEDDKMKTTTLNGINKFYIKNHDNPYEKYFRVDINGHYIGITKDYNKALKMLQGGK